MDFTPTELQQAIGPLAAQVLAGTVTEGALQAAEAGDGMCHEAWQALEEAGLAGLHLPGSGAGARELVTLLEEVGAHVAPVPALEGMVLAGWPLVQAGRTAAAAGRVTAAILEAGTTDPLRPTTRVVDGRLHGTKTRVAFGPWAEALVVLAADDGGPGLWLCESAGLPWEAQRTGHGVSSARVVLDGVPAERLGGSELVGQWLPRVHTGVAALTLGLVRSSLELTARYTATRHQFGVPIGSFQAVQQRAADAWIDAWALRLATWHAASALDRGEDATRLALMARFQASRAGHRVTAAAQHLHGGMGFDRDYPLYRRFTWNLAWQGWLGGSRQRLEELGGELAASVERA